MKKYKSLTIVMIAIAVVLIGIGAKVWSESIAPTTKALALQAEFPEQNLKELSDSTVYFVVPDYDKNGYCYFPLRRAVNLLGEAKLYFSGPVLLSPDSQSPTGKVQILSRQQNRFYNPTPEGIKDYKFKGPKPWPSNLCNIVA